MGGGRVDFAELSSRVAARQTATHVEEVFTQRELHEKMQPHRMTHRECIASDDHLDPLPIAFVLDTTGSMNHVPQKLARQDLLRLLNRLTEMASTGKSTPQICYCGVADTQDETPFQVGQFETDNRMDGWLTKIHVGGGAGPERMHEAYNLALYFLARKTTCDVWKKGGRGIAFITGDEFCPATHSRNVVAKVFGDELVDDLSTADLLKEVRDKWNLFFLYVKTGSYPGYEERIFQAWQTLLGPNAIRLDADATALPEVVSALVGITQGVYQAEDVPQDLRELGCDEQIVAATAKALNVGPGNTGKDEETANERRSQRRGPTKL